MDQTSRAKGPVLSASKAGRQLEHAYEARNAAQAAAKQELKERRHRKPNPKAQKPERFSLTRAWQVQTELCPWPN